MEPVGGEQAVPTVMALDTLVQPAPALLGEMKLLPYLRFSAKDMGHVSVALLYAEFSTTSKAFELHIGHP